MAVVHVMPETSAVQAIPGGEADQRPCHWPSRKPLAVFFGCRGRQAMTAPSHVSAGLCAVPMNQGAAMDDEIHRIEWNPPRHGDIVETACLKHEGEILRALRMLGIGCGGSTAEPG